MTEIRAFLSDIFADDPRVAQPDYGSAQFGSRGLRIAGKVFAMEWQGALAIKLSPERVRELAAGSRGSALQMGKRTMKEWLVVEDPEAWPALTLEAASLLFRPG